MSAPRLEVLTITALIDDPSRQVHSLAEYLIDTDGDLGHPHVKLVSFHCSELGADKGWTDAEIRALAAEIAAENLYGS